MAGVVTVGFNECVVSICFQNLLECQFDHNVKFKEKINTIPSDELRCLPIGRDFMGKAYWFQMVIIFPTILYHNR